MTLPRHTIRVVTLGCAKNTVDSEVLMGQLKLNNIRVLRDGEKGREDSVIINTCGFINDAKEESIETILGFITETGLCDGMPFRTFQGTVNEGNS